jgi:nucleotide-binding universal stress UspA family protein
MKMDKILVAVDLSDLASAAVEYAAVLAGAFKSHVHILHVVIPVPTYIGNEVVQPVIPADSEEEFDRIKDDLASMSEYLQKRNIESDYELAKGPVVETIIEKAIALNASHIVLGAHNHGFLYRAFIGSVCSGVVKHSPCPVTIIPSK